MPRVELTDTHLRKLKPTGQRFEIGDIVERALCAQVSPNGQIVSAIRSRESAGKLHTVTLGSYPDLKLKNAREQASIARQAVKRGQDVNGGKRLRRA